MSERASSDSVHLYNIILCDSIIYLIQYFCKNLLLLWIHSWHIFFFKYFLSFTILLAYITNYYNFRCILKKYSYKYVYEWYTQFNDVHSIITKNIVNIWISLTQWFSKHAEKFGKQNSVYL